MQKNLTTKTIVIAVTILLCIYGIIGIPKSKAELMKNLQENVRLGLDLRGGSHLILQVQVQDALKAEADQLIERLKEELTKANIDYASLDRNDPMTIEDADSIQINIKGVSAQKTSTFRSLINERFPTWVLTPVNATDYRMNLRAERAADAQTGNGGAIHPDHQQPYQQSGPYRTGGATARTGRRRVRDPGAVARRGRSGAGQGNHRHGGGSGDLRGQGRPVSEPGPGHGKARRRASAQHEACEIVATGR